MARSAVLVSNLRLKIERELMLKMLGKFSAIDAHESLNSDEFVKWQALTGNYTDVS